MLVAYFQPEYNDQLKSWSRTEPLKTLSNAGIDTLLLELHLHDNHPPVSFFQRIALPDKHVIILQQTLPERQEPAN